MMPEQKQFPEVENLSAGTAVGHACPLFVMQLIAACLMLLRRHRQLMNS
jgi:hypothetical protein